MNRRDFIRIGAALGSLLPAGVAPPGPTRQPCRGLIPLGRRVHHLVGRRAGHGAAAHACGGTATRRLHRRRFGRRRRHGRGAAGRSRLHRPRARGRRRSADAITGAIPCIPTQNTYPEDYDVPAFHPLATENDAIKWDFFVRHYADDVAAAQGLQVRRALPRQAGQRRSGIRAPALSVAVPRTTR